MNFRRLSTMFRNRTGARTLAAFAALALLLVFVAPAAAQDASGLAGQSLRPYRFVFLAYALLWIMVFGWVFSVGRRLSQLAERIRD